MGAFSGLDRFRARVYTGYTTTHNRKEVSTMKPFTIIGSPAYIRAILAYWASLEQ